jgi:hypothetical protein
MGKVLEEGKPISTYGVADGQVFVLSSVLGAEDSLTMSGFPDICGNGEQT